MGRCEFGGRDGIDVAVLHQHIKLALRVLGEAGDVLRLAEEHFLSGDFVRFAVIAKTQIVPRL